MNVVLRLVKGSSGKPLHPPLTDVSVGAYTLGVAALIAGKAGLQTPQMAHAALIAISFGLLLAAPTAITGLLDWLDIPRATPARTTATIHLVVMVATTVLFALTWLAQRPGYNRDEIRTLGLVLGIVAEGFLAVGGNIGGPNVFLRHSRPQARGHAGVQGAQPARCAGGGAPGSARGAGDANRLTEDLRPRSSWTRCLVSRLRPASSSGWCATSRSPARRQIRLPSPGRSKAPTGTTTSAGRDAVADADAASDPAQRCPAHPGWPDPGRVLDGHGGRR